MQFTENNYAITFIYSSQNIFYIYVIFILKYVKQQKILISDYYV